MNEVSQAQFSQRSALRAFCRLYTSIYAIDLTTGRFQALSSGAASEEGAPSQGDARALLTDFCRHMAAPQFSQALVAFTDLSTLEGRLADTDTVSAQYQRSDSHNPGSGEWMECAFLAGDRDAQGKLTHVLFTTQSIQKESAKELENRKEFQQSNRDLAALLAAEKQNTAIISALGNVFFALYCIDLEENTFLEIFSVDNGHRVSTQRRDARRSLRASLEKGIAKAYRPAMRMFMNLDTIDARLGDHHIISQEYISQSGSWSKCSFFPMERNEAGKHTKILCGLRRITAEKEAAQTQDNLILALSMSYSNVYAVNGDTGEAVCFRMGKTMQERYGTNFAIGSYEANIRAYIRSDVLAQDRPLFDPLRSISGIKQLLADKQTHYFNYRVLRNQQEHYYQCQLIWPNRKLNEFIIGFKNVNEEIQQELAQQQKVADALAAVEAANATLQWEMDIAAALSKDFPDVIMLELEENIAFAIKHHGTMVADCKQSRRYAYGEIWSKYISRFVLEDDRAYLYQAVSAAAVKQNLTDKDEYIISYRAHSPRGGIHHYQAVFFRIFIRQTQTFQFIVGFRNVDAIVEEEQKHTKIRQEQLQIIGALSQEYRSLLQIDTATGQASLYRSESLGSEFAPDHGSIRIENYEQLISKYIHTYVFPDDHRRILAATKLDVLLSRVPEVGSYRLRYRRTLEGRIVYYEMNVVKILDEGETVKLIMGIRDVDDEVQRHLKQLRAIEAQREIIEGLGSEYYSVLLVNPESDTVTSYRAEEEDGQSITNHFLRHQNRWSQGLRSYAEEWLSEQSREAFLEQLSLQRLQAGGEDYSLTYEKHAGGEITYLQARVSFVRSRQGAPAVVIGTRNVDNLIKKERQQEIALQAAYDAAEAANRAKSNFLSNMSHDIRTPMNGIIGMTAIATTHIDDKERILDCLQKITQASKHLLSLINEVLDMSKIESGKVELNEEAFNLSDLIDNLLSMTGSQMEEHHHRFTVNISGVTHEAVIGDVLRIQKIFTNLMGNAVKFTPDGGHIQLTISEKPSNQAKVGCYEFIFEDNGIGMREEFLERIFDPFSRAADGRVNKVQGTGLGMAISRNIVRMMGGDIKVESKLGVGSRFTVTMYLKLQDVLDAPSDQLVNLDVLVADDDSLSLASCCAMLDSLGMRADGVSTGAQAVSQVLLHHNQKQDYFACILDWKMPDMDGIATAKAIRKAVGQDVPIIILSAYDWSDIEQEARAAGVNAFISKPLFRSKLERTMESLVEADWAQPESPLVELQNLDLSGRRALLVEDNALNAEIAMEILQLTGLTLEHAVDGTEAVDMVSQCPDGYYDIVFMDIQMPRMNGYDATRAIRAMNRNYCKQLPIVAMTANAFAEDVLAAKTVGMNEHIAKPLDWGILARVLNRWLPQ